MKTYENEVMCIGSSAMDLVVQVDSFPTPDQISLAAWSRELCGGSSANVAVGLARLGLYTGLVSKVGRDREGVLLLNTLISEGVDIRFVNITGNTSKVIVLLTEQGEKTIVADTHGILNSEKMLPLHALHEIQALYVGECFLSVAEKALNFATEKGIITFLRLKNIHLKAGLNLTGVISAADYVLMNEKTYAVFVEDNPVIPDNLVITQGSRGCRVPTQNLNMDARPVTSVDTTGAGDAFCAAFIYAVLTKSPLKKALHFANTAAALSTTSYGGMDSMPTLEKIQSML